MDKHEGSRLENKASSDKDMECDNIYINQDELVEDDNQGEPNEINKECKPSTNSVTGHAGETCATDTIPPQNAHTSLTIEERLHVLEEKYKALVKLCTKMPCPNNGHGMD